YSCSLMTPRHPTSPLFPYTTLFRSPKRCPPKPPQVPKARSEFLCRECGYKNPRSLGRCPECDAWGSFDELLERAPPLASVVRVRSEEHTSELQSRFDLVCRLLLEKK